MRHVSILNGGFSERPCVLPNPFGVFLGGGCISFDRVVLILFLYSRSSFVYVPLICSCSADEVRDWRPSIFLGMVEARLIDLDNIRINIRICPFSSSQ